MINMTIFHSAQNSMSFLDTLKAAAAGPPPPESNNNSTFPRVGSHSSLSSTVGSRTVYGRLKRVPKLPAKPALQSSESSSATDDLSGSEESSSSCLEDADAEAQQVSYLLVYLGFRLILVKVVR